MKDRGSRKTYHGSSCSSSLTLIGSINEQRHKYMISLLWPIFYFIFITIFKYILGFRERMGGEKQRERQTWTFVQLLTQSLVDFERALAGESMCNLCLSGSCSNHGSCLARDSQYFQSTLRNFETC